MPLRHKGNLHDLYTGTWTTVCTAEGESRWSAEQLDHGDEPLRYDREVDDLEKWAATAEKPQFSAPRNQGHVVAHNGRVNNSVERE